MARIGCRNYVVARKGIKAYMEDPIHVEVKSITTDHVQKLYLSKADCENLKDKRILIVDDVISTGESLAAMEELLHAIGGQVVGKALRPGGGRRQGPHGHHLPGAPAPVLQVKRWCGPSPWWAFCYGALVLCAALGTRVRLGPGAAVPGFGLCHAGLPRLLGICRPAQGAAHMARAFGCVSEGSCPFSGAVLGGGSAGGWPAACAGCWPSAGSRRSPYKPWRGRSAPSAPRCWTTPRSATTGTTTGSRWRPLGQEGGPLEEVGPFTLRLSATMPLACQPFDWVECAVTFTAFDSGGGLYSTLNSRLADGFQAGAYLSQYQGIVVEENPSQPPGELLARMRRQVGRALDKLLPRREAGFLRAMVLGDGSGISEEDMGNFRELGVSHMLVVSGMHMTVLAAFLQLALKRLPIRKAVGNPAHRAVFAAVFGPFRVPALGQPAGAAMYGVLLLADSTGRRSDGLNSLGAGGAGRVPGKPLCRGRLGLRPVGDGHAGHCAALPPLGGRLSWGGAGRAWPLPCGSRRRSPWRQRRPPCWGPSRCSWRCLGDSPLLLPLANFLMAAPGTALLYLAFRRFLSDTAPWGGAVGGSLCVGGCVAFRLLLWMAQVLSQWKGAFLSLSGSGLLVAAGLLALLIAWVLAGRDRPLRKLLAGCMVALAVFGGVFQGWLDRGKAVFRFAGGRGGILRGCWCRTAGRRCSPAAATGPGRCAKSYSGTNVRR